jgi:hypothetical protein
MIQYVAPHLLESFPTLDDLEKMVSGELTGFASKRDDPYANSSSVSLIPPGYQSRSPRDGWLVWFS